MAAILFFLSLKSGIKTTNMTSIVLFYKYVAICETDGPPSQLHNTEVFLSGLCKRLGLLGRIILADEGINGNLGGTEAAIKIFCEELQAYPVFQNLDIDFKMDVSDEKPFPDMVVKIKSEICSTGQTISKQLLDQGLGGVHLPPQEFHKVLDEYWGDNPTKKSDDLIVIDVRNRVEFQVGRFMSETDQAIDPGTKNFSTWTTGFAAPRIEEMQGKRVLMYCTGGIRCEKASAFLRTNGVQDVSQLSGGIHRYLEEFGSNGYFKGSNFVFDSRALQVVPDAEVVGKCSECSCPEQQVSTDRVCAVCRSALLVCDGCRQKHFGVYYCDDHKELRGIYEPFLDKYDDSQLQQQAAKLQHRIGIATSKNHRKSLRNQVALINGFIETRGSACKRIRSISQKWKGNPRCRQCGRLGPDDLLSLLNRNFKTNTCNGKCTGFSAEKYKSPKCSLQYMNSPEFKLAIPHPPTSGKRPRKTSVDFVQYEIQGELRCVTPYVYVYSTFTKKRWIGQKILDMYVNDFGTNRASYYVTALDIGLITVNEATVTSDYVLKDRDIIHNYVHRHEPPVKYVPAQDMIVYEDECMLVIDKPASIPVHAGGSYRNNSLLNILAAEHDTHDFKLIHRLDRLTSGLVLISKDKSLAAQMGQALMRKSADCSDSKDSVQKLYLARVHGKFLDGSEEVANHELHGDILSWNAENHLLTLEEETTWSQGLVYISCGIRCCDSKHGVYECAREGDDTKSAMTRAKLISYDAISNTSLVKCEPVTGRTHQIRLHLTLVGHPIVNDPNYGFDGNVAMKKIKKQVQEEADEQFVPDYEALSRLEANVQVKDPNELCKLVCVACNRGLEAAFRERHLRYHGIDLHAYRYRISLQDDRLFDYHTKLPGFAKPFFKNL